MLETACNNFKENTLTLIWDENKVEYTANTEAEKNRSIFNINKNNST